MIATALAMLLALAPQVQDNAEEIVVVAKSGGCDIRMAERSLSDQEFNRRAAQWASAQTTVRVRARYDADLECLTKIAFRLADKGVRKMEFIDPMGRPAKPLVSPFSGDQPLNRRPVIQSDIADVERRFFAREAARLILEGKCAEAKKMVLEGGDLAAAADVVTICGR